MSGGYSTVIDAENDFILNSHILAKLRKAFKNKMILRLTQTSKNQHPAEMIFETRMRQYNVLKQKQRKSFYLI